MGSQQSEERQSSVTLSVDGRTYTAEVWCVSPKAWLLLEVRVDSGSSSGQLTVACSSLEEALLHAEKLAVGLIAVEDPGRP